MDDLLYLAVTATCFAASRAFAALAGRLLGNQKVAS